MAFYDTGATYDTGLLYDEAAPPIPRRTMAKVKLNLQFRSDAELLTFAQQHDNAMTGNANFATPNPAPAAFQATMTAFETALLDAEAARQTALQKTGVKDTARLALEAAFTQRGAYVDTTAAGDEAKILSSGLPVRDETSAPPTPLTKPANVSATAGDDDGELDVQWNSDPNADSYEVQSSPDPITATSWVHAVSVAISKVSLTGLPGMAKRWVRVRSVRGGEQGPWSDPACAVVT